MQQPMKYQSVKVSSEGLLTLSEKLQFTVNQFKVSASVLEDNNISNQKLIEWDQSYSVMVKEMDDQHKKLFDFVQEIWPIFQ